MRRLLGPGLLALALLAALAPVRLETGQPPAPPLGPAEVESLAQELAAIARARPAALLQALPGDAIRPVVGAAALELTADDVVLGPADLGPDWLVASSGEKLQFGATFRAQTIVRAGRLITYVEPDGVLYVRSLAQVLPDIFSAEDLFNAAGKRLFEGTQEMKIPPIGERSRGGVEWGEGPYDPAARAILFRTRTVVGVVIVGGFDAPLDLDDVIPLARQMAAKAGR